MVISETGRRRGQSFLSQLNAQSQEKVNEAGNDFCTVTGVSGNLVSVKTTGALSGGHLVARVEGPTPSVGDRGVLMPVGGSSVFVPLADSNWTPVNAQDTVRLDAYYAPTFIMSPLERFSEVGVAQEPTISGSVFNTVTDGGNGQRAWYLSAGSMVSRGNPENWVGTVSGTFGLRLEHYTNPSHPSGWILHVGLWEDSFIGLLRSGDMYVVYVMGPGNSPSYQMAAVPITEGRHSVFITYGPFGCNMYLDATLVASTSTPTTGFVWGTGKTLQLSNAGMPPTLSVEALIHYANRVLSPDHIAYLHAYPHPWRYGTLRVDNVFDIVRFAGKGAILQSTTNTASPVVHLSQTLPLKEGVWRGTGFASAILNRSVNTGGMRLALRLQMVGELNAVNYIDGDPSQLSSIQTSLHRLDVPLTVDFYTAGGNHTLTIEWHGLTTAGTTNIRNAMMHATLFRVG